MSARKCKRCRRAIVGMREQLEKALAALTGGPVEFGPLTRAMIDGENDESVKRRIELGARSGHAQCALEQALARDAGYCDPTCERLAAAKSRAA